MRTIRGPALAKRLRQLTRAAIGLFVAACATVPRFEAAGDIHEFLVAIRDGDQARFDAHVDRSALKVQLKSRLLAGQAAAHGDTSWQALGAALAGPLVDLGVDAYVQPQTFRAVALRHRQFAPIDRRRRRLRHHQDERPLYPGVQGRGRRLETGRL
jgi:hypothetical protein